MPLAADNVLNAYDPEHQTLDGRANLNELSMGPAPGDHLADRHARHGAASRVPGDRLPLTAAPAGAGASPPPVAGAR